MLLFYAFYGSCALSMGADSYLIDSIFGYLFVVGLAGGSPAATHFLLLRQKKVSKEKATLLSATPSLRYGAPCGTRFRRGPRKLASLKQRAALIRLKLRSSAQTEGVGRMRDRNPYCTFPVRLGGISLDIKAGKVIGIVA